MKVMNNWCRLVIIAQQSAYTSYVYVFTRDIHDSYQIFFRLESYLATCNYYYGIFFTPNFLCSSNITVVLLNHIKGKIQIKLNFNDYIINKLDQ